MNFKYDLFWPSDKHQLKLFSVLVLLVFSFTVDSFKDVIVIDVETNWSFKIHILFFLMYITNTPK